MAIRIMQWAAILGIGQAQQAVPQQPTPAAPPPFVIEPPQPAAYAALSAGCGCRPVLPRYERPEGVWLAAAYDANGIHYQPVPPPGCAP